MKPYVAILAVGLLLPGVAPATLHPMLIEPRITSCRDYHWPMQGNVSCSAMVYYAASGTEFVDMSESGPPHPAGGLKLISIGLHCEYGWAEYGRPFSGCSFTADRGHHPDFNSECRLKSTNSWELADPSKCTWTTLSWGVHSGAGPGGECVLIVQDSSMAWGLYSATTIHGTLNADAVANAGGSYCQKALPPDVTCDIDIPPTLEHGEINTNSHSVRSVDGTVACGSRPKVAVVGGGKIKLGQGLSAVLTAQMDDATRVRLTSTLDAINAESGVHSGAAVVVVSPY